MVGVLAHRGPDAQRTCTVPHAALGHTRLSVIDLDTGDQPMADASERYWIVYNGELYNYRELRAELDGYAFRTSSDTEVLLAAWLRWGPSCLDRFRGMFAFAVWDTQCKVLFAARDLFGEKPLYYALDEEGNLLVSSELKGILASHRVDPILDFDALDGYLALGFIPPDRTIYRNVYTLPPAHWLAFDENGLRLERYWQLRLTDERMDLAEAADRLGILVRQAVRRQLVADVPIGAFLSGGLDSSTIVAVAAEQSSRDVKTFSVGFGHEINELPYARAVADRYGTERYEMDLGEPEVAEQLERMVGVYDEPFADTSNIPTYLISAFARRHVKVALSGDGADELLGGYDRYLPLARSQGLQAHRWQWLLCRACSRLVGSRWPTLDYAGRAMGLAARWPDMWTRGRMSNTHLSPRLRRNLWGDRWTSLNHDGPLQAFRPALGTRGLNRAFYFDLTCYLPGDILVKVGRAAMAHGLETRAPFLDRDLVEFILGVPGVLKVENDQTKILLRGAFANAWPPAICHRGKQGFGSPIARWRQRPDVQELAAEVFASRGRLRQLLPGLKRSTCGRNPYGWWILLVLGLWLEKNSIPL